MQEKNWIMGLWKFSDKISQKDLGEIAEKWAEDPKYLQLYIRKVSKDQNGIGFTYDLGTDKNDEAYKAYHDKTTDFLKRKFGNDLAGWDLGSAVWVIKDANLVERPNEKKAAQIITDPFNGLGLDDNKDPFAGK